MKNIFKSLSFSITSLIILTQLGCSTPTTSQPNLQSNSTVSTNNQVSVKASTQNSFQLTQKDANGTVNPIVPEDIESITVNGKVVSVSQISVVKGAFNTKAHGDITVSFKNGKFYIEGLTDSSELKISFKLKNTDLPINYDYQIAKISGDLRFEITRDNNGKITSISGGLNNNGGLDTNNSVFSYDINAGTFTLTNPSGEQTKYTVTDATTELKLNNNPEKKNLTENQTKEELQKVADKVTKPSVAAPFVGKWKYSVLGYKFSLQLRESGSGNLGYNSILENSSTNYKGSFNGNVNYTSENSNMLNLESMVNSKPLKGKVELQGDNSLVFTLTQSDVAQVSSFVNVPMTLERDTM